MTKKAGSSLNLIVSNRLHNSNRRVSCLILLAIGALFSGNTFAQEAASRDKVTTIERKAATAKTESDAKKFKTREGRLESKPLDWNTTTGKPTYPSAPPSAQEERAKPAEPSAANGGAPNPKAKKEAQKRYRKEWRKSKPAPGATGKLSFFAGSPDIFSQYCENCPNV